MVIEPEALTAVEERILAAAAELYVERGLAATTLTAIADRAGVSRPTVYSNLGDQDAVTSRLVEREIGIFFAELTGVLDQHPDVRDAIREGIVFTVSYVRRHELLQRMLEREPAVVVTRLTLGGDDLIAAASGILLPRLTDAPEAAELGDPRRFAELAVRLALSLILTPSPEVDRDDETEVRCFLLDVLPALRTGTR